MEKQVLRGLYVKYGKAVIFDSRKLKAHLLDMRLPKKSVNLLVDISKSSYFKQFAEEIHKTPEARDRLVYAIAGEYAFEQSAVEFGADCWVYTLIGGSGNGIGSELNQKSAPGEEIWPEEKAELVAAALRELMRDDDDA